MNYQSLAKTSSTAFKSQTMQPTAKGIMFNFIVTLFITFAVTMLIEWGKEKARQKRLEKQQQLT